MPSYLAPFITLGTDRAHYRVRPCRTYTVRTIGRLGSTHAPGSATPVVPPLSTIATPDYPSPSLNFHGTGGGETDGDRVREFDESGFEVENECPEFELGGRYRRWKWV
ncbi:hypothetical protein K435DRAFT_875039 [Dendrothele bispora CBS 962.96]|uniref:Uncharacterized protein n=1 Tax=Dendrothele bispora (strain CBS 962.96) TaxID=1314807 RepID=A0A4S8KV61_DENBC|nr:hypothetical protein K435DRAFT_875039 [Dendrothele bispora CBS 962.96]